MDYESAREYIKNLTGRGICPGLDAVTSLLDKLENPHEGLDIIHIAGTNGKGSVGAYLSSILQCTGHTVMRFVTPPVGGYLDTFLYNGAPVSETDFAECVKAVKSAMDSLSEEEIFPTSFEAETAIAFLLAKRLRPDYLILECGMGGRGDATNVIPPPKLSVITKISLDHTAFLGSSISEIAAEKAGIIKSGTKVVTAIQHPDADAVIKSVCKEKGAELFIAGSPADILYNGSYTEFTLGNNRYKTQLLGSYQPQNAALAIEAMTVLGIDQAAISDGIANTKWPYRFERVKSFILDGAHNPDAAKELLSSLGEYFEKGDDVAFVCACFKDKDYRQIAQITAGFPSAVYCVKPPTDRGLDAKILADTFKSYGAQAHEKDTLKAAILSASEHKNAVVFGTLSILAQAKQIIEGI